MTTSYASLTGPGKGDQFDVTDVGDTWTEMVNVDANLSLYECLQGETITGFTGAHAAGCTLLRVRNQVTNVIKMMEFCDVEGESKWRPVETPFQVQDQDILEAFHVVVPT
jgi:hypothetical protein